MGDDLIPILTRFHREVLLPDVQRVVGELRQEMNERFAGLDAHFDAIDQRFDKLEALGEAGLAGALAADDEGEAGAGGEVEGGLWADAAEALGGQDCPLLDTTW